MGTKDALRQRVMRLLQLGMTQKAIAARMGMSQAALSRWINDETVRVSLDALDGFTALEKELAAAIGVREETQRSAASAEIPLSATGTAGSPFRPAPDRRTADLGHGPTGERRRASDR